jgi:capsular exopolysaccharide synthesis family protein
MKPTYTASVLMYVNTKDSSASTNLNDLNYAQKVVTTYINFLRTKTFFKQVVEESELNYAPEQIRGMTQIQAINNTELFEISVVSFSANDSYILVKAMQKIAPVVIHNIKNTAEITVVDPVIYPLYPSGPNVIWNTMMGGMLGFLLSLIVSFLWEVVDIKVKDQQELMKRYQLPVLGAIPNYNVFRRNKILTRLFKSTKSLSNMSEGFHEETKFIITEAYKSLRTNLRFTLRKTGCKKIMINSPMPQDGKSTISMNLAIVMAQTGAKVLLLDCDLRKGKIHKLLHLKGAPGITDILSGIKSEKELIQNTTYENLQVITMGSLPPNPSELLASVQMEELLANLEKSFDYIIIDSPPVNVVSDSLCLGKLVDGVIVVVIENASTYPLVTNAVSKYKFADIKVLGFVLNKIRMNQGNKSKSNYYYSSKK